MGVSTASVPPDQYVDLVDRDVARRQAPQPAPFLLEAPQTAPEAPPTRLGTPPTTSDKPDQQQAIAEFRRGCSLYRQQQFEQAIGALQLAMQADPSEPVFAYVLAMAQFQLQRYEQAEQSVARAVTLERTAPVKKWGRTMEGYQGPARGWLERTRRQVRQQVDAAEL